MKINKLNNKSKDYSKLLREISSAPSPLYCLGDTGLLNTPSIAVVGSRKTTPYGRETTYQIAYNLALRGITIVSGLALGIDAIAHKAALEAKGKTIAVMAGGMHQIYPATNRNLAKSILAQGGLIISEYEQGMPSLKQNFVARNRIVSGLSLGVVVMEAAESSGSLITAGFALEQNRVVMAVPGNITSNLSTGTNNLIKVGASLVTSASDVLNALELEAPELKAKVIKPSNKEEKIILDLLASGVNDSEELIKQSGLDASQFNRIVTLMEISGKIRNMGAGKWISG